MKKMCFFIASLFISFNGVMAEDVVSLHSPKIITEYRYGKMDVLKKNSSDENVYILSTITARVTEDKILKIKEESVLSPNRWSPINENVTRKTEIRSFKLRDSVFKLIKEDSDFLSTANIKTIKHNIVCMMMPVWAQSNDHLFVLRTPESNSESILTLVDGPRGCWLNEQTHPSPEIAVQTAVLLKRTLKVLSL